MATSGQSIFGRDMIFNLMLGLDWRVVTAANQRQVDIDNVQENNSQGTYDYVIGDQFYV